MVLFFLNFLDLKVNLYLVPQKWNYHMIQQFYFWVPSDLMRHEPGWVCPLKSWGRGWPRALASAALGAQRSSLWAGKEQVQFQGWTSLFHPLRGREEGQESLSSFDLGSRGPAVNQAPSKVSQLPDDRAGTRAVGSWCSVRCLGLLPSWLMLAAPALWLWGRCPW